MMRKLLAAFLAVMICVCCAAACAEEEAGTKTFASVSGRFTLEIPDDYVVVEAGLLEMLGAIHESGSWEEVGLSPETGEAIYQVISSVDLSAFDLVYTPDMSANMNCVAVENAGFTPAVIETYKDTLDEQIKQSYAAYGIETGSFTPHDLLYLNGRVWYSYELDVLSQHVIQYMCGDEAGTQYQLTFTQIDGETALAIISTFSMAE